MRLLHVLGLVLGLAVTLAHAGSPAPVKIIFDTDMSGDTDDVAALAILNEFADMGKAEILACVANGHDQDKASAAAISAVNTYYGRPNVPIGTYQGPGCTPSKSGYTAALRDDFPQTAKPDDQAPKAVDVYRQALVGAPDHNVVIVSVGFLINLRELLESKPDAISPMPGIDLVRQKVKQLVCMGGQYPESGYECNFEGRSGGADAQYAVEHWPTPILFSGGEIGQNISSGKGLRSTPITNPVRRACDNNGHPSWDPTAVLAAVEDPHLYWNVSADGYCEVHGPGNTWHPTPNRGHSYLIAKVPNAEVGKVLDDLLMQLPKKR